MISASAGAMTPSSTMRRKSIIRSQYSRENSNTGMGFILRVCMRVEHLEELVQRAVAAREHHQRDGPEQEVHLADGEVVEVEAQMGGDVRIGRLLERQDDVEPDVSASTSWAPRLAASITPGPPPVTTTTLPASCRSRQTRP